MADKQHPLATWRQQQPKPLSQRDLARKLKVSRWTINSIETGRRAASADLVEKIVKLTGGEVPAEQIRPDLASVFGAAA